MGAIMQPRVIPKNKLQAFTNPIFSFIYGSLLIYGPIYIKPVLIYP